MSRAGDPAADDYNDSSHFTASSRSSHEAAKPALFDSVSAFRTQNPQEHRY